MAPKFRTKELVIKRKRQRTIKMSLYAIFFIVLISGLSFWSQHDSVTISQINIEQTEFANIDDIRVSIENILSKKYIHLFARSNFFLFPKNQIRKEIIENNISVYDLEIDVQGLDVVNIKIKEHGAVAKWCGADYENRIDTCYLVNNDGIFFTKDKDGDTEEILEVYGIWDGSDDIVGQSYIDKEVFKKIITFNNFLSQLEISADYISTVDSETFAVQTSSGPYLLIEKNDEAFEIFNNLKTVIDTEELNKAQLSNIEYIDLRFGNKVYYKIK